MQTNIVSNTLVSDLYVGLPPADYDPEIISVVPNPFHEQADFILSSSFTATESELSVMNSMGELVLRKTTSAGRFTLMRGTLSTGIYFYEVKNKNKNRAVGKFVID